MALNFWRKKQSTPRIATNLLVGFPFVLGPLMSELRIKAASYEMELSNVLSRSAFPHWMKLFHVSTVEMELIPAIQAIVVMINTAKAAQFESEFLAPVIRRKLVEVDDAFLKLKLKLENTAAYRPPNNEKKDEEVLKIQVNIIEKVEWLLVKSLKNKEKLKYISETIDDEWQVLNIQKDIVEV